jgi:hypothetical protein
MVTLNIKKPNKIDLIDLLEDILSCARRKPTFESGYAMFRDKTEEVIEKLKTGEYY